MGWVMAGLGFHGLDMPKFIRPMTHPSSGPPQPSPFPARPIGLGQGSAMGWWAEPKPMRTIVVLNLSLISEGEFITVVVLSRSWLVTRRVSIDAL